MTEAFDPSGACAPDSGIYGLPHTAAEARVHVVPVPFDATASYRKGAALAPEAVLRASHQVDLFDLLTGKPYQHGIAMLDVDPRLPTLNAEANALAQPILDAAGELEGNPELSRALDRVNEIGDEVNDIVHARCARSMDDGKLVVVLGGDHSTPFGAIRAAAERHPGLGILHFDAHADLRVAYEGFTWSHASILHNVMTRLDGVAMLRQVAVRDLCEEEFLAIRDSGGRIAAMFADDWRFALNEGRNLREIARRFVSDLPERVWVSFDVDALDPPLCPNTGTPVPGGLTWSEAMLWLDELSSSGRTIVGADLVEVSPGETPTDCDSYDAIIGARLLYRMIGVALRPPPESS